MLGFAPLTASFTCGLLLLRLHGMVCARLRIVYSRPKFNSRRLQGNLHLKLFSSRKNRRERGGAHSRHPSLVCDMPPTVIISAAKTSTTLFGIICLLATVSIVIASSFSLSAQSRLNDRFSTAWQHVIIWTTATLCFSTAFVINLMEVYLRKKSRPKSAGRRSGLQHLSLIFEHGRVYCERAAGLPSKVRLVFICNSAVGLTWMCVLYIFTTFQACKCREENVPGECQADLLSQDSCFSVLAYLSETFNFPRSIIGDDFFTREYLHDVEITFYVSFIIIFLRPSRDPKSWFFNLCDANQFVPTQCSIVLAMISVSARHIFIKTISHSWKCSSISLFLSSIVFMGIALLSCISYLGYQWGGLLRLRYRGVTRFLMPAALVSLIMLDGRIAGSRQLCLMGFVAGIGQFLQERVTWRNAQDVV